MQGQSFSLVLTQAVMEGSTRQEVDAPYLSTRALLLGMVSSGFDMMVSGEERRCREIFASRARRRDVTENGYENVGLSHEDSFGDDRIPDNATQHTCTFEAPTKPIQTE